MKRRVVFVGLVFVAVAGGLFATCLAAMEDEQRSRVITKCRTPLADTAHCGGFNDSWTECRWAFRAEGRPDRALCERFLNLARGRTAGAEPTDYDDVRAFSETNCVAFAIATTMRCFTATRSEHEATNRYLQAFDAKCDKAVVLRSCNVPLEEAARAGR